MAAIKRIIFLIFLGVLGAWAVRRYGFEAIYLATNSMAPVMPEGTHVYVNKFHFLTHRPQRGEIVLFDSPMDPKKGLVKRVIAVPGDRIQLMDKKVILNGQPMDETYVRYESPDTIFHGDNTAEVVVPPKHIFVLGDNRDVSGDSRDWIDSKGEWAPFVPWSSVTGLVMGVKGS